MIDRLRHKAMRDPVMTAGTEVKGNIDQALGTFEDKIHINPISDFGFEISD